MNLYELSLKILDYTNIGSEFQFVILLLLSIVGIITLLIPLIIIIKLKELM